LSLQVVLLLIKEDTVSVNAAGIQRMHDVAGAWAAAALVVREQLAGVQYVTQQQASAKLADCREELHSMCVWSYSSSLAKSATSA